MRRVFVSSVSRTDIGAMNQAITVQPGTPLWAFIHREWNEYTNEPSQQAAQQAADAFELASNTNKEPKTFDGWTQKEWAQQLRRAWVNGVVSGDDFDFVGAPVIEADWPGFRFAFLRFGKSSLSYTLKFSVTPPKDWEQDSDETFAYEFDFDEKGNLTTASTPNFMSELFGERAIGSPEEIFALLDKLAELPDSAWSDKALTLRAVRSYFKEKEATK